MNIRLGPISEAVLATIAIAGVISVMAIAPALPMAVAPFIKKDRKQRYAFKQSVKRNISSLLAHGLIEQVKRKNGSVEIRLTEKGVWETTIRRIIFPDPKQKKWDGKWRLVIFDIVEQKRTVRNELRRAMLCYGFTMIQKSVWVYPYPCDEFIKLIKGHLGIAPDVLYVIADSIENQKHLEKHFKLASR